MNTNRFKQGDKKPSNTFMARIFLKLNKVPFLRNTIVFRKWFGKLFHLPLSCSWNKDFYCSSSNIIIGANVGLADTFILSYAPVYIGSNTSFSFRNMIITSSHDLNDFSTVLAKPIIIGKNVWITSNVTILPGVTIGDNTIIGAGSIVTNDIPSNVLAAGNPCKVIKSISFNK